MLVEIVIAMLYVCLLLFWQVIKALLFFVVNHLLLKDRIQNDYIELQVPSFVIKLKFYYTSELLQLWWMK